MPSRGFILLFTPGPKESKRKVLHESLKMTISGPCVKIPRRRLKLIFTPNRYKRGSLWLEIYSLGLFENMPSRGFIVLFTPGPKDSNRKVLHKQLKMTISGHCVKIPPSILKLIFTTDPAKPASLRLGIYSLGLLENMP